MFGFVKNKLGVGLLLCKCFLKILDHLSIRQWNRSSNSPYGLFPFHQSFRLQQSVKICVYISLADKSQHIPNVESSQLEINLAIQQHSKRSISPAVGCEPAVFLPFLMFLHKFSSLSFHNDLKTSKKRSNLTSKCPVQHPLAGPIIQQLSFIQTFCVSSRNLSKSTL